MSKSVVWLSICVTILLCLGLLMVYNTTSAEALDKSLEGDTHGALLKQLSYAVLGIGAGVCSFLLGYRRICKITPILMVFVTILLAIVFIPNIGQEINGARRWLNFFGFSFQPSELAKYILPIFFINWVLKQKKLNLKNFAKVLFYIAFPIFFIFLEPDNGTTAIILVTLVVIFFLTKVNFRYWALPLMVVCTIASALAYKMPHVRSRIEIYLHPELDLMGKGHQPHQAKIAAGSGKFFGKGLGASLQKLNYLPEARSDYIAAIYAEELGFLGIVLLIGIYCVIAFLGFYIAMTSKEKIGLYIASCITFLIAFQSFLNLGVVSGLLPSKGTTLPFFSQGGSSLIVNLLAIGILLSIGKEKKLYEKR